MALVAMPTCDAPGPLASKNTRSPAWIAARSTCTPALACSKLVRGSVTPAWANAHWVRPEQSHELGPTPPSAYGAPSFVRAAATAEPPPPPTGAAAPWMPSAPSVCGPTTPSTSSPWADWNARTARRVWRPNTPSALMPSARWTAIVVAAGSRWSTRRRPAAAAERPARDRPDDAVDLEPVRGLERAHRAPRLAPEHAVGAGSPACAGPRPPPGRGCRCAGGRRPRCRPPRCPGPARRRWPGASTVAVISAAETSACFLR